MNVLRMGANETPDYGLGWAKREDFHGHIFVIFPLPLGSGVDDFGMVPEEQRRQTQLEFIDTVIVFDEKNGTKSLKALIGALTAMLKEWEAEDDHNSDA